VLSLSVVALAFHKIWGDCVFENYGENMAAFCSDETFEVFSINTSIVAQHMSQSNIKN
jgi:hypothetical protein